MRCSIIIPVYHDEAALRLLLADLRPLLEAGQDIIVVDGAGERQVDEQLQQQVSAYLFAGKGRARQMNAGADRAKGEFLWFLHADTRLDAATCMAQMTQAIQGQSGWGRFDVRLSGSHGLFRMVETLMNRRSCLTGIATGDQGMFVSRELFDRVAGFPEIDLMEDVQICRQLKRLQKPHCLPGRLVTSSRRWEERGIIRTILLMWSLRLLFFLGVPASWLARLYR